MMRLIIGIFCIVLLCSAQTSFARASRTNDFIYAAIDYHTIRQFKIAADGTLVPLSPPSVSPGKDYLLNRIVVHPNKRFLYVECTTDMNRWVSEDISTGRTSIHPYRIADDGTLVPLTPVVVYTGPVLDFTGGDVAMDPKGRFLYVLVEGGTAFLYRIRRNGELSAPRTTRVVCNYNPVPKNDGGPLVGGQGGSLQIDSKGRLLYASDHYDFQDIANNEEAVYWIDQKTGDLKLLAGPFDSSHGDRFDGFPHFDPDDGFAYAIRKKDGVRIQYRLTNKGALVPTGVKKPRWPDLLTAFSPDHRYGYAATGDRITVYRIARSGRFTAISRRSTKSVYAVTLAPSGGFLYAASNPYHRMNEPANCRIAQFRIRPDGSLAPLNPPLIAVEDYCIQMIPIRLPAR